MDETKSKTALNQAKVQEIIQGDPGEMEKNRMEAQNKREEHGMKMVEMQMKVQSQEKLAQIKAYIAS